METLKIPKHIAIIMDGNGRWAHQRGLMPINGHEKGAQIAKDIATCASKIGVKYLTLYTFSSENWLRPEKEIWGIMKLLKYHIFKDKKLILDNNIKLRIMGNLDKISNDLKEALSKLEHETKDNDGMELIIALSYGARDEIINAVKKLVDKIDTKKILPNQITEEIFSKQLYTDGVPDPDLLIRTGKELRVSNFLLWQIAYTEFYFSEVLWPDFTEEHFKAAIDDFIKRERRYGK